VQEWFAKHPRAKLYFLLCYELRLLQQVPVVWQLHLSAPWVLLSIV